MKRARLAAGLVMPQSWSRGTAPSVQWRRKDGQIEATAPVGCAPKAATVVATPKRLTCSNCGKPAAAGRTLGVCARCRRAQYCNVACQTADWVTHRRTCKPPQAQQQPPAQLQPVAVEQPRARTAAATVSADPPARSWHAFVTQPNAGRPLGEHSKQLDCRAPAPSPRAGERLTRPKSIYITVSWLQSEAMAGPLSPVENLVDSRHCYGAWLAQHPPSKMPKNPELTYYHKIRKHIFGTSQCKKYARL